MSSKDTSEKPDPPSSLPKYVTESVERQDPITLYRVIAYASEMTGLTPKQPVMTDDFDVENIKPSNVIRHTSSKSTVRDNTGQVARVLDDEAVEFWDSDGKIKTIKSDSIQKVSEDSVERGFWDKLTNPAQTDNSKTNKDDNSGEDDVLALDTDDREKEIEPPQGVPKTLVKGMKRQDNDSLVELITYAKSLLEQIQKPPDDLADDGEQIVKKEEIEGEENWTKVVKRIPCGKNCNGCPHGPYLYLVRRKTIDKLEWRYLGRVSGDDFDEEDEYPDQDEQDEEDEDEEDTERKSVAAVPTNEASYPDQPDDDEQDEEESEDNDDWDDEIEDYVSEEDGTV